MNSIDCKNKKMNQWIARCLSDDDDYVRRLITIVIAIIMPHGGGAGV